MQKFAIFLKNFFSLILRGVVIGTIALMVFLGGIFVAAQSTVSGGEFGKILNKILASGDWQNSDGTVKQAEKLGNYSANDFQIIKGNKSCNPGMCMTGFNSDGTIQCQ